jgi:hypothetical protein
MLSAKEAQTRGFGPAAPRVLLTESILWRFRVMARADRFTGNEEMH